MCPKAYENKHLPFLICLFLIIIKNHLFNFLLDRIFLLINIVKYYQFHFHFLFLKFFQLILYNLLMLNLQIIYRFILSYKLFLLFENKKYFLDLRLILLSLLFHLKKHFPRIIVFYINDL